jgi:hypothetical protein
VMVLDQTESQTRLALDDFELLIFGLWLRLEESQSDELVVDFDY